ncbi:MAG: diguanylate cyclase domain-containing protein, partial [Huintestinicola sp.]
LIFSKAEECIRNNTDFYCEVRGYRFDGSVGWFCIRAKTVDFIKSDGYVFLAAINDISRRMELSDRLSVDCERVRILGEISENFLFEYHIFNDSMTFFRGLAQGEFTVPNYSNYLKESVQLHPGDVIYYYSELCRACRKTVKGYLDIRSLDKKKEHYILFRLFYSSIADEHGNMISVVGRCDPISEDPDAMPRSFSFVEGNPAEAILKIQAAINVIDEMIVRKSTEKFLVIADIDGFSKIIEGAGRKAANNAMTMLGEQLSAVFSGAAVYRFVGDKYVAYIENITESELHDMEERLRIALSTVEFAGNADMSGISVSLGAAHGGEGSEKCSARNFFITAEKALMQSKKQGGNCMFVEKVVV